MLESAFRLGGEKWNFVFATVLASLSTANQLCAGMCRCYAMGTFEWCVMEENADTSSILINSYRGRYATVRA